MSLLNLEIPNSTEINIIAPFIFANGGDWHAIDIFLEYSKTHKVRLWSPQPAHTELTTEYPIQEIKPYRGLAPSNGILIISGVRTAIGQWYKQSSFDKIILIHNLLSPRVLYEQVKYLSNVNQGKLEIIYVSELVKKFSGLNGKVIYHLPPVERFKPVIKTDYTSSTRFLVGRVSSDILAKHHHTDPKLYMSLVNLDIEVRITGGTCLRPWLDDERISLLPSLHQSEVAKAYNDLDCFYYRVPSVIKEPYGLVVIEAMLSGLPVVCHRDIGCTELIMHGINGFIFDTPEEATDIILLLKNNANLREKIGISAREVLSMRL